MCVITNDTGWNLEVVNSGNVKKKIKNHTVRKMIDRKLGREKQKCQLRKQDELFNLSKI